MDQRTILFLTLGKNIEDPSDGPEMRTANMVEQIRKNGLEAVVLDASGNRYFNDVNPYFYYNLLATLLREDVDIIHVSGMGGVLAAKGVTAFFSLNVPVVCEKMYVEGVAVSDFITSDLPFYKRVIAPVYIPLLESLSLEAADKVMAVSEKDKRIIHREYNIKESKIEIVPSGTSRCELNELKPAQEIREKYGINESKIVIVFVGIYSYFPNREAIAEIKNSIAPAFVEENPQVQFVIAGRGVPEFKEENVVGVGFVDDLLSFLHAADIGIAPLSSGGGTKIKIFDYMNVSLPIVTTEKGAEGIGINDGEHALITGGTGMEFVRRLKSLVDDESKREELGRNARRLVEERYNWEKIGETLADFYNDLLVGD